MEAPRGSAPRVEVVVVEDHPLYRDALAETIDAHPDFTVVGKCADGEQAIEALERLAPDVAVLDLRLPGSVSGLEVLRAMAGKPTRVLLLSEQTDSALIHEAACSGAAGYLHKGEDRRVIREAIATVARGGTVFTGDIVERLLTEMQAQAGRGNSILTPREREIVTLVADGLSDDAIALKLHIGATTVKTHLQHVYGKLGVANRTAAATKAVRDGLLT